VLFFLFKVCALYDFQVNTSSILIDVAITKPPYHKVIPFDTINEKQYQGFTQIGWWGNRYLLDDSQPGTWPPGTARHCKGADRPGAQPPVLKSMIFCRNEQAVPQFQAAGTAHVCQVPAADCAGQSIPETVQAAVFKHDLAGKLFEKPRVILHQGDGETGVFQDPDQVDDPHGTLHAGGEWTVSLVLPDC
jgi:hypothetical protein